MHAFRWIASAMLAWLVAAPASAASLQFTPTASTGAVGDQVSVGVEISDLAGEPVSAFDLTLNFDPAIASVVSVTPASQLNGGDPNASFVSAIGTSGNLVVAELSLLSDADLASIQSTEPVQLFTVDFSLIGPGTSPLSFQAGTVPGVAGLDVKGRNAALLDVVGRDGSLTAVGPAAAPVPEPSSILLAGIGLLAGALVLRQRSAPGR